jgi:hypothetical protein
MPRSSVDLDTVREIALALPDVEEATAWGATGFKVGGRLMACQAIHSSAEDDSLMVRVDLPLRDELLAAEPDVYYVTPHYEPYPAVVVRLARVKRAALKQLLGTSWVFVSSSGPKKSATSKTKRKKKASTPRKRR